MRLSCSSGSPPALNAFQALEGTWRALCMSCSKVAAGRRPV